MVYVIREVSHEASIPEIFMMGIMVALAVRETGTHVPCGLEVKQVVRALSIS